MTLVTQKRDRIAGITSIPRLITLVGNQRRKPFGFSDQFLAYQCQANRFVTVIKYISDYARRQEGYFNYDYMISEINQAYLRCNLTGSLRKTVNDILKTYQSDLIILEDAGKVELSELMKEVSSLGDIIRFDSLTTVVDSFTAEKTIEMCKDAQKQIVLADIILLDKKELLDEIRMQNLVRLLKELNPTAPIISVKNKDFDPSLVYGINLMSFDHISNGGSESVRSHCCENDMCDHLCATRYAINHPMNKSQFFKRIEEIPDKVFRLEGLIRFKDEQLPVHLQYVGGRYDIRDYPNPKFDDHFMVVVGKNVEDVSFQF
jgi:G3E family GTPase